jgi:hypothetical protein
MITVLERICLWAPFSTRPNPLTFLFVILRMALLSAAFVVPAILFGLDPVRGIGEIYIWTVLVTFEELARLSILRDAERKWLAGAMFVLGVVLIESVGLFRPDIEPIDFAIMRLPTVLLHIGWTAAMIWLVRNERWRGPGVIALTALHIIYDVFASRIIS